MYVVCDLLAALQGVRMQVYKVLRHQIIARGSYKEAVMTIVTLYLTYM